MKWDKIPDKKTIEKTIKALKENNINAFFFEKRENAKNKVLEIMPKGSEVFTLTSMTLEELGISKLINEGEYYSIRNKLNSLNMQNSEKEMKRLGCTPDYAIGSIHALTENGEILIASNTGSQLSPYSYGAKKVIWIVGAQKIVKNLDEGFKRIYEHSLLLESERAKKAYGVPGSSVNKILIINKEAQKDRTTLIIVNEILGF